MSTNEEPLFDCGIIGGGLAGLTLAIQLAKKGHQVVVIEKGNYPRHSVCGEYISMESWDFLISLGLPMSQMNPPIIHTLRLSSPSGFTLTSPLKMGGFGMSRYCLDFELYQLALKVGVHIQTNCKATNVIQLSERYQIETTTVTINCKLVCGSYGKLTPSFFIDSKTSNNSYVAVKYHIQIPFKQDEIELHNFKNGYCGISMVDSNTCCLCYITTAKNLKESGNDIKKLERTVLMKNPHLKRYFTEGDFLFERPLTISQISFKKKKTTLNGAILLGDAAGTVAPLCGNGMSMAFRSSAFLAPQVSAFLEGRISKKQLVLDYSKQWSSNFSTRIKTGYFLQQILGNEKGTNLLLQVLSRMPWIMRGLIRLTHGQRF